MKKIVFTLAELKKKNENHLFQLLRVIKFKRNLTCHLSWLLKPLCRDQEWINCIVILS